jgi:hypothetical protein
MPGRDLGGCVKVAHEPEQELLAAVTLQEIKNRIYDLRAHIPGQQL